MAIAFAYHGFLDTGEVVLAFAATVVMLSHKVRGAYIELSAAIADTMPHGFILGVGAAGNDCHMAETSAGKVFVVIFAGVVAAAATGSASLYQAGGMDFQRIAAVTAAEPFGLAARVVTAGDTSK